MTTTSVFSYLFKHADRRKAWITDHALDALRISLGVVFIWFGALKFFPGFSPAEGLAADTMRIMTQGLVPDRVALVLLAVLETGIGLGLLTRRAGRLTLFLLFVHLAGTTTPFVLLPTIAFEKFPAMLTMEGQYIVKNAVLASAGLVLATAMQSAKSGSLSGGQMVASANPPMRTHLFDHAIETRPRVPQSVNS